MKRVLAYLLLMLVCLPALAGSKRALVVCIGDYPAVSGWNPIASQSDKAIILDMLARCGFDSENVICLEEAGATYGAITSALETLARNARSGDQIYVHFSCHGQQITDQDGDEALANPKDLLDESLVPYDASVAFNWHNYRGENHLLDDTLNGYLARIQKAVGKRGFVLLVADACHSGDISREDVDADLPPFRGAVDVFKQPYQGKTGKPAVNPVTWISFSACKEFQTNFEVEVDGRRYGRLSYAISRCLKPGMTAEQLADALSQEYRRLPMPKGKSQSPLFDIPSSLKSRVLFDGQ